LPDHLARTIWQGARPIRTSKTAPNPAAPASRMLYPYHVSHLPRFPL